MNETNKLNINWEEVSEDKSFDPMPAGVYSAIISGAEMKTPASGKADYLSVEYTIAEGEFKDRKVWDSLSINSDNITAANIAKSRLKSLAIATCTDLKTFSDPEMLLNRLLNITIGVQAAKDNFGAKNTVKKVEPLGEIKKPSLSVSKGTPDSKGMPTEKSFLDLV